MLDKMKKNWKWVAGAGAVADGDVSAAEDARGRGAPED